MLKLKRKIKRHKQIQLSCLDPDLNKPTVKKTVLKQSDKSQCKLDFKWRLEILVDFVGYDSLVTQEMLFFHPNSSAQD